MVAVPATPRAHAEEEPTTLTVAVVDPTVDSLNPFTTIYRLPTQIHRLMYDYLTMYSAEDATPTEGLAESWEHSDDGLTWTYTIRDDSTFSDGEPVTAEDVAYTYNTIMADNVRCDGQQQLRRELRVGHRDRRAHRRDQAEAAVGLDARDRHPDRAPARLGGRPERH